jgi:hypothetical protein
MAQVYKYTEAPSMRFPAKSTSNEGGRSGYN